MQELKALMRKQITAKCKMLSQNQRDEAANGILINLMPLLSVSSFVAVYHANGFELSLNKVINFCVKHDKKLYQPVSYKHKPQMQLMPFDDKQTSIFYSTEYATDEGIEWYNMDLILLPLVAVDRRGYRLGKGGGYYDATLALLPRDRTILCGVGFSCQMVEELPYQNFDVKLDYFVSELGLTKF